MILIIAGVLLLLAMFAALTAGMVSADGWETAAFAWGITLLIVVISGAGSLLIVLGSSR